MNFEPKPQQTPKSERPKKGEFSVLPSVEALDLGDKTVNEVWNEVLDKFIEHIARPSLADKIREDLNNSRNEIINKVVAKMPEGEKFSAALKREVEKQVAMSEKRLKEEAA